MMEELFIKQLKKRYTGKWIGIRENKVFAISNTRDDIYKKLREKQIKDVYVFYSPTAKEKNYGFLFWIVYEDNRKQTNSKGKIKRQGKQHI